MSEATACPLCAAAADPLYRDDLLRVVLVDEPELPGYARLIVNPHRRELTDLAPAERGRVLDALCAVEAAQRAVLRPDKINLASLGNQVPHLHWHIIPRFVDDPFFPDAIWAPRRRQAPAAALAARRAQLPALTAAIRVALTTAAGAAAAPD
jgi:diadenosine tetraphosphate (Ap4A) HIT family hydrolase